eukprot:scaffold48_cov311-Pinguiococcus_pyrenoidosus.AAC.267
MRSTAVLRAGGRRMQGAGVPRGPRRASRVFGDSRQSHAAEALRRAHGDGRPSAVVGFGAPVSQRQCCPRTLHPSLLPAKWRSVLWAHPVAAGS